MRGFNLLSILLMLVAGGGVAFSQATQLPTPHDEPSVAVGNNETDKPRIEHRDKSHVRDLKGVVRDEHETPVEGAIVKIKNLDNGKVVSWRTPKDGSYVFHELDMNTNYELTVTHEDFDGPVMKKLSQYDTRKPATLNVEMQRKKASAAASHG